MTLTDWIVILFMVLIVASYSLDRGVQGVVRTVREVAASTASIDNRLYEITQGLERIAICLEGYHADHPDDDRMVEAIDGIAKIINDRMVEAIDDITRVIKDRD